MWRDDDYRKEGRKTQGKTGRRKGGEMRKKGTIEIEERMQNGKKE